MGASAGTHTRRLPLPGHPPAGDGVAVTREDGTSAVFVVDEVARYDKSWFPVRKVFGCRRPRRSATDHLR